MTSMIAAGIFLTLLSGGMNGLFTLPMRFLGQWSWENVWAIFIVGSCVLLPAMIVSVTAPASWNVILHLPMRLLMVALVTGFAWGFGAIMFGQSVSAIGISLANTFVLATSSALGAVLPMVLLAPQKLKEHSGLMVLAGVGIEICGIALCGRGGFLREQSPAGLETAQRGRLVGKARPLGVGFLLALGSGVLSAVFNIGFALSHPISEYGQRAGLSLSASTNLIWVIMLGSGALANLGFCGYLLTANRTFGNFSKPGGVKLYGLSLTMAALWGGSIFVYGAATTRLGPLGASLGWPLSLTTGLLVANLAGIAAGEWNSSPKQARSWMFCGIGVLLVAIVVLSRAV